MQTERSKSLKVVLRAAERDESEAATRLFSERQQLRQHSFQLQQLSDYNHEYSSQIGQLGVANVQQMLGQRNFLSQLEQMVQSQSQAVEQLRQQTQRAEQIWHQRYQKRKKLAELIERIEREHDYAQQQLLQKELDELSRARYRPEGLH